MSANHLIKSSYTLVHEVRVDKHIVPQHDPLIGLNWTRKPVPRNIACMFDKHHNNYSIDNYSIDLIDGNIFDYVIDGKSAGTSICYHV